MLYSNGLISKEKSVRLNESMRSKGKRKGRTAINFMPGTPVPKLASYDKLISFVNSLDVGNVNDICTEFSYNLDDDILVNGAYRELEEYV